METRGKQSQKSKSASNIDNGVDRYVFVGIPVAKTKRRFVSLLEETEGEGWVRAMNHME